jgi:hypothetical protein
MPSRASSSHAFNATNAVNVQDIIHTLGTETHPIETAYSAKRAATSGSTLPNASGLNTNSSSPSLRRFLTGSSDSADKEFCECCCNPPRTSGNPGRGAAEFTTGIDAAASTAACARLGLPTGVNVSIGGGVSGSASGRGGS